MRLIRISVLCLIILIVLGALDLAVLRAINAAVTLSARVGLIGSLPMANFLAISVILLAESLIHRGEVKLSRLAFLFVGAAALVVLVYILVLAPELFYEYLEFVSSPSKGTVLGRLTAIALVTPLMLVPALLAGWLARGYRVKLLPRGERQADRVSTAEMNEAGTRPAGR